MAKATGPTYVVPFKRRRHNLTNYSKRLALLKAGVPRLVVRKTNRSVIVQLIQFTPSFDKTLVNVNSAELKSMGWHPKANLPTAYLSGMLCASRAKKAGMQKAVLDIGLHTASKGSFLFAALKGALDGGMEIPAGEISVDENRLSGKHIADYAKSIVGDAEAYKRQFGDYIAAGKKPENIDTLFADMKKKILGGAVPAPKVPKPAQKPATKESKPKVAKK